MGRRWDSMAGGPRRLVLLSVQGTVGLLPGPPRPRPRASTSWALQAFVLQILPKPPCSGDRFQLRSRTSCSNLERTLKTKEKGFGVARSPFRRATGLSERGALRVSPSGTSLSQAGDPPTTERPQNL